MNEHFDGLNMGCDPMVAHKHTLTFLFVACGEKCWYGSTFGKQKTPI